MSVFNLDTQNSSLDYKLVAGFERLSQVFRILLWEKAKLLNLSPIQIQLLIFIRYHTEERSTISYLAREFNFTKPTISDAIKILEEKKLVKKIKVVDDTRSYTIRLTAAGTKVVVACEGFTGPVTQIVAGASETDKKVLWQNLTTLIRQLNKMGIINVQRTCYNCRHYTSKNEIPYCNLLNQTLLLENIRIDCGEFEAALL